MAEKHTVNIDDEDCLPAKRVKLDDNKNNDDNDDNKNNTDSRTENNDNVRELSELNLSTFKVARILQNNSKLKSIIVQGTFKDCVDPAIVFLEQKSFSNDTTILTQSFFNDKTTYRKIFTNDVYNNYDCLPSGEYNSLQASVIYPASPYQIEKYQRPNLFVIINETYQLYQKVTLPFIKSMSLSVEWVNNILEHKAEKENIIYEDTDKETGFILVSDYKWNKQPDTLKLIALPFKKIRSLRELNASHLPLLKNIQKAGIAAISKKFNIPASQLRIYFHYLPSYYHLHVHFCNLMFEAPGTSVEKAHFLSTVISNLELMSDYYTKAVLSHVVRKGSWLYDQFKLRGALSDLSPDVKVQDT